MCPGPAAPANNASGFVNARISVPRDGWTPSPPVRASAAPPIPSCAHPRPRYGVRAASWARPGNWPGPLRIGWNAPSRSAATRRRTPLPTLCLQRPGVLPTGVDRRAMFSRTRGLFKLRSASPDPHGRRVAVPHPQSAVPAPTAWRAFLSGIRRPFQVALSPAPLVAGLQRSALSPPCRRRLRASPPFLAVRGLRLSPNHCSPARPTRRRS